MSKIRKAANGQACFVRIPGKCNWNPETSTHAHLNGAGMGKKALDLHGCPACDDCHKYLDKHPKIVTDIESLPDDVRAYIYHRDGIIKYQQLLHDQGLIKTPGSK